MFARLLRDLSLHVPSQCAVCRAWPAQPVCDACVDRFAQPVPRCRTCALPVPAGVERCGACIRQPGALDACLAAVSYGYPWSGLIQGFKFRQHAGRAGLFALLLRSTPWVEPALEAADLLLPIPLSARRLRERGYNQALLLARELARNKTDARLLLRIADTPPQSSLNREERLRNVTHAFAVDPLRAGEVRGKRLVLVDDVMTSGASLQAAAHTLKAAGAAHVGAVVIARTEEA